MMNLKKIIPNFLIATLAVFTFIGSALATDSVYFPKNFDPNPNTVVNSENSTEFLWNASDFYKGSPLVHFEVCFVYITPNAMKAIACTETHPDYVFKNHLTMTGLQWGKIIGDLQNTLNTQNVDIDLKHKSSIQLQWFVQGIYKEGTLESQPWPITLQH